MPASSIESRFSNAQGQQSVVENVEAGNTFGPASFVTGLPSTYKAIALEPTRLLVIGAAAYAWLMDEVPGFARANVSPQTANERLAQWAARGWIVRRYRALEIARWPAPAAG